LLVQILALLYRPITHEKGIEREKERKKEIRENTGRNK
jgi:hypothetical protein